MSIWKVIEGLISILAYFFDPSVRRKREKEKLLAQIDELETKYAKALTEGNPNWAAEIDLEMTALRERVKYLEKDN